MKHAKTLQLLIALIAVAFGVLTLFVGTRVLRGADPGYVVFRPLLVYNVVMGVVYVLAGVLIGRGAAAGKWLAGGIAGLNALVLAFIAWLHASGGAVAVDSVRAMAFRTGVWVLLFGGVVWLGRRRPVARSGAR